MAERPISVKAYDVKYLVIRLLSVSLAERYIKLISRAASIGNIKFWEELIAYFPFIRHGLHRKRLVQQFFVAAGTSLPSRCLATIGNTQTGPHSLILYDTDRIENDASNNSIVAGIGCHGNVSTEPLHSNYMRDTHMDTQTNERDLRSAPLSWAQVA
jgi:hypothetical protein